jgi:hypothetical protein
MLKYVLALAIVLGIAAENSHCDHAKAHGHGGKVAAPSGR